MPRIPTCICFYSFYCMLFIWRWDVFHPVSPGMDFHILIWGGWKNIWGVLFGFGMGHGTACKSRNFAVRLVLGVRTNPHHQIIKIDTVVFKYCV